MSDPTRGVYITGCGVVSAAGRLQGALWRNLLEGQSGVGKPRFPIDAEFGVRSAAEVDAAQLGTNLDCSIHSKSTVFIVQAVADALADAGLRPEDLASDEVGVALGTNFANVEACLSSCNASLVEGWRGVRPTLFPSTMITTPAGQVAIHHKLRGPNATLSTGHNAGVDALLFAIAQIAKGRAKVMIVGGVEALSRETSDAFAAAGLLARTREGEQGERCAPYDERASGMVLGEGAAAVVVEACDFARRRGAARQIRIGAVSISRSAAVECFGGGDPGPLTQAMTNAMRSARLSPADIDCISGSADSGIVDGLESRAVCQTFPSPPPVTAVKGITGECFGASPIMQIGLAVESLREQVIPPVCNFQRASDRVQLRTIVREPTPARLRHVLVNSVGWDGSSSAVLVSSDLERSLAS